MTGTPKSITEDELAEAFGRQPLPGLYDGKLFAAALFANVAANRESEYEPGVMYRDANENFWLYDPACSVAREGSWADCPWLKPGDHGAYSRNTPLQPLRKLVPEGSRPDRAAILAEITAWANSGYVFEDLADRICKLLEGGSDD